MEPSERWIIRIYRRLGPDASESELVDVPVPNGRWQNATHAILHAWRSVEPWEVRAEIYNAERLVEKFSYAVLDYPEKIDEE